MATLTWTVAEVAALAGGALLAGAPGARVTGCALDSRAVKPGAVFAALRGERADGHDYCAAAVAAGAALLLVEREVPGVQGVAVVRVPSVAEALRALGRGARERFDGVVVGIVGSCGKTTTKDFAAAVLARAGTVTATAGNRNNLLGVPETLLNADPAARFWVLELGISTPGEMGALAPVALPDGVVFTTVQAVHLEFFPSVEAIRDEKVSVLSHVRPGGFAVVNADDPLLAGMTVPEGLRRLTYGRAASAAVRLDTGAAVSASGFPFALSHAGRRVQGFLPVPGEHQAMNFAAACTAGIACGMSLDEVVAAAPSLKPARHRGELRPLASGALLLDDSYNSNPAAVRAVLASAAKWGRRTVAVLGEMRELGPDSARFHAELGREAAATVEALATVGGEPARAMAEAYGASGRPVFCSPRWEEARAWVEERLGAGDLLVVKGSRAVGLDGLADALAGEV